MYRKYTTKIGYTSCIACLQNIKLNNACFTYSLKMSVHYIKSHKSVHYVWFSILPLWFKLTIFTVAFAVLFASSFYYLFFKNKLCTIFTKRHFLKFHSDILSHCKTWQFTDFKTVATHQIWRAVVSLDWHVHLHHIFPSVFSCYHSVNLKIKHAKNWWKNVAAAYNSRCSLSFSGVICM